jgi:hypothetical protein
MQYTMDDDYKFYLQIKPWFVNDGRIVHKYSRSAIHFEVMENINGSVTIKNLNNGIAMMYHIQPQ